MKIFTIAGSILTLIATVFLYLGSKQVPWEIQTFKGQSEKEKDFRKKRQFYLRIGFCLLFLGFLLQLVAVVGN